MAEKPCICIAVPAHTGLVRVGCVESLFRLTHALQRNGIASNPQFTTFGDIVTVRNTFASLVASSGLYSHLLFVDYDMGFEPDGVIDMFKSNLPVVGWAYRVRSQEVRFAVRNPKNFNGTFCEADATGTGLMLIKREALIQLQQTGKLLKRTKHMYVGKGYDGPVHGFFDQFDEDGEQLTEDFAFCKRWRELCSGRISVLASRPVSHIGDYAFTGSLKEHHSA